MSVSSDESTINILYYLVLNRFAPRLLASVGGGIGIAEDDSLTARIDCAFYKISQ